MAARSPSVPTAEELEQEFIHNLAIEVSPALSDLEHCVLTLPFCVQMSRLTNAINPNDLLARRMIDIAKGNRTGEAFLIGMLP